MWKWDNDQMKNQARLMPSETSFADSAARQVGFGSPRTRPAAPYEFENGKRFDFPFWHCRQSLSSLGYLRLLWRWAWQWGAVYLSSKRRIQPVDPSWHRHECELGMCCWAGERRLRFCRYLHVNCCLANSGIHIETEIFEKMWRERDS